jgi:signal transduction histidine kinase/ligand-binding sensor domain-containing protein
MNSGLCRRAFGGLACTVSLFLSSGALAMDPTEYLSELHHTEWTTREGAPGQISAIAQTSDGYLWLGTSIGLFRFDGESFEQPRFSGADQIITGDVSALYAAPSGDLWIGMRFGGAYVLRQGRLTKYMKPNGQPVHTIRAFAERPDGTIWAATSVGLCRFGENRWMTVGEDWHYPAKDAYNVLVDRAGTLWVRTFQGTFFLPSGAAAFEKSPAPGGRGWLLSDSDGSVWASDPERGLYSLSDHGRKIPKAALDADSGTQAALADRDGGLWIVVQRSGIDVLLRIPDARAFLSGDGRRRTGDIQVLRPTQSLTGAAFNFLEDREGDVWVATDGGLDRFRRNKLHSAAATVPPLHDAAMTADSRGDVWLANPSVLLEFPTNQIHPIVHEMSSVGSLVSGLWIDSDEGVMIAVDKAASVSRYFGGKFQEVSLWPDARSPAIQSIAKDQTGALWVSSVGEGLFRKDDTGWKLNGGLSGLPKKVPLSMLADATGKLWLAYPDNEMAVVENGRIRLMGSAQGLNVGVVLAMAARGDRTWIGGTDSVSLYLRGHFWPLLRDDGRAFTGVSGIVQDDDGTLWLNGAIGVSHIGASDVDAFVADPRRTVPAETMSYEDGLGGVANQFRPLDTALKSVDGRIWFTTSAGAYWIDPRRILRNTVPPPVSLKYVAANGRTYPLGGNVALPAHTTSLEFGYTALSLSIPSRVRFKYKLDGVDADWQDAGNRRQAFYTNVVPGKHRFQVIAANEDGVWNEAGAASTLVIAPAFYQTWWFYSICAIAALAILWQLYILRFRLLSAQLRVQIGARLEERERIARELHDTLLQSAQGLILLFQGFVGRLGRSDPMRRQMESALDQADELLNEARDRVGGLRDSNIDSRLPVALKRFGDELFAGKPTGFTVMTTGSPRPLTLSVADDTYWIGREALINAMTHAQAANVELEIAYEVKQFRIHIRDDGKGIRDELLNTRIRDNHFGVQGMRERAQRIGGTLILSSRDGAGTEVELTVSAALAYREYRAKPRWIGRFFASRKGRDWPGAGSGDG